MEQERQCNLKRVQGVQTISNLTVTEDMRQVIKKLLFFSALSPDSIMQCLISLDRSQCELLFDILAFHSSFRTFHILFGCQYEAEDFSWFFFCFFFTCSQSIWHEYFKTP